MTAQPSDIPSPDNRGRHEHRRLLRRVAPYTAIRVLDICIDAAKASCAEYVRVGLDEV
jgi:hypothetical protein